LCLNGGKMQKAIRHAVGGPFATKLAQPAARAPLHVVLACILRRKPLARRHASRYDLSIQLCVKGTRYDETFPGRPKDRS
jgi:hypothetical protein